MSLTAEKITSENAARIYEESGASLRQAYADSQSDGSESGSESLDSVRPVDPAQTNPEGDQAPDSARVPENRATQEPVTPPEPVKDEPAHVDRAQYEAMEKRFKAIQASITPTQQENARLRQEVQALSEKLKAAEALTPVNDALSEKITTLREILPEAAAVFDAMEKTPRAGNGSDVDARLTKIQERLDEAQKEKVQNSILQFHEDAPKFYHSPEFRGWVDSLGPIAESWNNILDYPWNYENGAFQASEIISAYKADLAANVKPPAPPRPAAPIPSDLAPGVTSATRSGSTGADPNKGAWSAADLAAKNRELKNATPQRAAQIAEEIKAQMRLAR